MVHPLTERVGNVGNWNLKQQNNRRELFRSANLHPGG